VKKFILISFGFMGWAFYEMSGGQDFEPASVRLARMTPVTETELSAKTPEAETVVAAAEPSTVDTDPPLDEDVTRVSLNLNDLTETLAEAIDEVAVDDTGVPRNVGTPTESANTPAIIPSLIVPNTGITQVAVAAAPLGGDIRTVSGNRVNVRGGPSTDFDVVNRLVRGNEVEILEDNGNGWVRMRPIDGSSEGWMADFLLNDG
jgi:uncharacterized protein YgiM (DUF1202 family)